MTARRLTAGAVAGVALLFAVFALVVRAEPRPGLASGSLLLLALAVVVLRGPAWTPLLAVPVGLAVLDRVREYVSFSLERPGETAGLVFSSTVLAVVGLALVAGPAAVSARGRRLPGTALLGGGLAVSVLLGVLLAGSAQPDQAGGLTARQRAALPVVVLDDYRYRPDVVRARAGQELLLLLVNDDTETYRFAVEALGVDVLVPSGREAVVRLTADAPGALLVSTSEEDGEHRSLGMVGRLVVTS